MCNLIWVVFQMESGKLIPNRSVQTLSFQISKWQPHYNKSLSNILGSLCFYERKTIWLGQWLGPPARRVVDLFPRQVPAPSTTELPKVLAGRDHDLTPIQSDNLPNLWIGDRGPVQAF